MNFAENLTALRKARGETQEQLGEVLGISGKTISKWESAVSEPDLGELAALSEHFAVSTDELLGRPKPADAFAMMRGELNSESTLAGKFKHINSMVMGLTRILFGSLDREHGENYADAVPECDQSRGDFRSITQHPMGTLVCCNTMEAQVAAQVWRNASDFAWLWDDRERMAEYFAWLGDPDTLALLYMLERVDFSFDFTAAYAAEQAGISAEKAAAVLEKMLTFRGYAYNSGVLSKAKLETLDGECTVYSCNGCGTTMAILSLARTLVKGWNCNCNAYNENGKMIGEGGRRDAR